jgi:hypothetical protein
MKNNIMLYEEFKQHNYHIYHFTNIRGLLCILFENVIKTSDVNKVSNKYKTFKNIIKKISLTRDKYLDSEAVYNDVRITLNYDKLKNKYKIYTYDDFSDKGDKPSREYKYLEQ